VLFAVVVGVLLGHFYPQVGTDMKPLGDGFIKLIKMIIAPIIFCTVVVGIAGMEDMKKVGKTGGLALLYFEIVSTLALIVGLVIVNFVQPGVGMNVDASTLDTKSIAAYTAPGKMQSTVDFLLNVIPSSVVDAFAKGEILQVLLFSVLFGFALHKFGGRGTLVFDFIEKLSHVLFDIVGINQDDRSDNLIVLTPSDHMLVPDLFFQLMARLGIHVPEWPYNLIPIVVLSVTAYVSYRLIELPIQSLKRYFQA
jgi:aerobic C4-dicarboxylate transport protein